MRRKLKVKRPHTSYMMAHLKRPWHESYIKNHQRNVTHQMQFNAAQQVLQDKVNGMREASIMGRRYA